MAEAQTDFDDDGWKAQLEYNKQGVIVNNLKNLLSVKYFCKNNGFNGLEKILKKNM